MLDFGSGSARPHPKHRYYVIEYVTNQDQDVQISGKIFNSKMKFWTLCCYDQYGIPLLHNYDCETIKPCDRGGGGGGSKHDMTDYTVTLTSCGTKPIASYPGNAIDVSKAPTGIVLVRVIYPDTEEVFINSKPQVKLVKPPDRSHETKKQK